MHARNFSSTTRNTGTDGAVVAGLKDRNIEFTIKMTEPELNHNAASNGIDSFLFPSWNNNTNTFDSITEVFWSDIENGLRVSVNDCNTYCGQYTGCSRCATDARCTWCTADGGSCQESTWCSRMLERISFIFYVSIMSLIVSVYGVSIGLWRSLCYCIYGLPRSSVFENINRCVTVSRLRRQIDTNAIDRHKRHRSTQTPPDRHKRHRSTRTSNTNALEHQRPTRRTQLRIWTIHVRIRTIKGWLRFMCVNRWLLCGLCCK